MQGKCISWVKWDISCCFCMNFSFNDNNNKNNNDNYDFCIRGDYTPTKPFHCTLWRMPTNNDERWNWQQERYQFQIGHVFSYFIN